MVLSDVSSGLVLGHSDWVSFARLRHDKHQIKDVMLRNPIDAKVWKEFDEQYPTFTSYP